MLQRRSDNAIEQEAGNRNWKFYILRSLLLEATSKKVA
jgi:hypothetical protein